MISVYHDDSADRALAALHDVLQRYHAVSRRNVADTLARKANDIRIQLFRGYWAQRVKGSRKGAKNSEGVMFRQMRQRAKADEGIRLRSGLPSEDAPTEYYQRRRLRAMQGPVKSVRESAHGALRKGRVLVTMSTYQRRVWTELARRQAGIGVLGVAFLMRRYRYSSAGRRLAANKGGVSPLQVVTQAGYKGDTLGRLTLGEKFARIEGMVPGHARVGHRHSILAIALGNVRADTEAYLARKEAESLKAELAAAGVNAR